MGYIETVIREARENGESLCEQITDLIEQINTLELRLSEVNQVLTRLGEEALTTPRTTVWSDSLRSFRGEDLTLVKTPEESSTPPASPSSEAASGATESKPDAPGRKKPVVVSEAQARDWICQQKDWFSSGDLRRALNVSQSTATRLVRVFVDRKIIEPNGAIAPPQKKYRYVKPKDPGPGNPPPPKEKDPRDVTLPERGGPVAGTGRNQAGAKGWTRNKDINELLDKVQRQGGLVQIRPNNHIRVINPKRKPGENVVGISQSPSEQGVVHLVAQDLRKAGFDV